MLSAILYLVALIVFEVGFLMGKVVVIGTFDSESLWREQNLSMLPAMADSDTSNIITAMDELLFILCEKNDKLITRFKIEDALKQYLYDIGFTFCNNEIDLEEFSEEHSSQSKKCNFQLLVETRRKEYFRSFLNGVTHLSSYSIIPYVKQACQTYGLCYDYPDINIIKMVNSKLYSYHLNSLITERNYSKLADDSKLIEEYGMEYLKHGPFLIKDLFGVSGKGNLLVDSENILKRIVHYIEKQEKKGMCTKFLLEPFLYKEMDFSCQFFIDKDGSYKVLSIQRLFNRNFAYLGSSTADKMLLELLEKEKYFMIIERIANHLYKDGYYGNVCVDSMILKKGEIVPIVEINARKSMGLLNYYLDKHFENYGVKGSISFLSVGYSGNNTLGDILSAMESKNILFKSGFDKGIIPLSSNTLFINRKLNGIKTTKFFKGRFYFSTVSNNPKEGFEIRGKMKGLLISQGFNVYN